MGLILWGKKYLKMIGLVRNFLSSAIVLSLSMKFSFLDLYLGVMLTFYSASLSAIKAMNMGKNDVILKTIKI